jgi:hypothetical protein
MPSRVPIKTSASDVAEALQLLDMAFQGRKVFGNGDHDGLTPARVEARIDEQRLIARAGEAHGARFPGGGEDEGLVPERAGAQRGIAGGDGVVMAGIRASIDAADGFRIDGRRGRERQRAEQALGVVGQPRGHVIFAEAPRRPAHRDPHGQQHQREAHADSQAEAPLQRHHGMGLRNT